MQRLKLGTTKRICFSDFPKLSKLAIKRCRKNESYDLSSVAKLRFLDVSPCSLENFRLPDTLRFCGGTVKGKMKWPSQLVGFQLYYTGRNLKEILTDLPEGLEGISFSPSDFSLHDEAFRMLTPLPKLRSLKIVIGMLKYPNP